MSLDLVNTCCNRSVLQESDCEVSLLGTKASKKTTKQHWFYTFIYFFLIQPNPFLRKPPATLPYPKQQTIPVYFTHQQQPPPTNGQRRPKCNGFEAKGPLKTWIYFVGTRRFFRLPWGTVVRPVSGGTVVKQGGGNVERAKWRTVFGRGFLVEEVFGLNFK